MSVVDFPQAGTVGSTLKPKRYDIEIYQGDTFAFTMLFKDAAQAVVNVTGWSAIAQIKNIADGTPAPTPAFTAVIGGADGKITLRLTDTESSALPAGEYKYDVQVSDGTNKRTYIGGKITVTEDISE